MKDTVCCGCSVVCDDVAVEIKRGQFRSLGLCRLGHEYCGAVLSKARLRKPLIRKTSKLQKPATMSTALSKAIAILQESQRPLFYGWSASSNQTIQVGLELAQQTRGVFDSTTSLEYGALLEHQLFGGDTDSVDLEEVRNNADHIIYWGVNPAESHHRHASRFTIFPKGEHIPEGRESRVVSVVDIRNSESMRLANHQLIVSVDSGDEQLLTALLDEIQGKSKALPEQIAGLPAIEFLSFAKQLKEAKYITLFYGNGLIHADHVSKTLSLVAALSTQLNTNHRHCITLPMVVYSNSIGAVKVSKTKTTLPYAVDFAQNPPKPHPSVLQGLVKGEFDCALITGIDALSILPGPAVQALQKLPIIALSALPTLTTKNATVVFPSAITGAEVGGNVHRMDGVKISLDPFCTPPKGILSEKDLLKQLLSSIR